MGIHGGLTVSIQGTDAREKGGHNPSLRPKLKISGNQIKFLLCVVTALRERTFMRAAG